MQRQMCDNFLANPTMDPQTGRWLKEQDDRYKSLMSMCKKQDTTVLPPLPTCGPSQCKDTVEVMSRTLTEKIYQIYRERVNYLWGQVQNRTSYKYNPIASKKREAENRYATLLENMEKTRDRVFKDFDQGKITTMDEWVEVLESLVYDLTYMTDMLDYQP